MEYTFFIDKIRKLRKEAGYTQEDVSRKLNIQRQTYCNYENGTRMPPLEIIIALADLYKLSVDALVRDGTPVLSPEPPQLTSYQATTIQTFLTLSEESKRKPVTLSASSISFAADTFAFANCFLYYTRIMSI